MIELVSNLPKEAWASIGVVIGALIAALITFINATFVRHAEKERLSKIILLDEALTPVLKHFNLLRREVWATSISRLKDFIDREGGIPELSIISQRYSANWSQRYYNVLDEVIADLSQGGLLNVNKYAQDIALIQNEIVLVYEWQCRNLAAWPSTRKRVARRVQSKFVISYVVAAKRLHND